MAAVVKEDGEGAASSALRFNTLGIALASYRLKVRDFLFDGEGTRLCFMEKISWKVDTSL